MHFTSINHKALAETESEFAQAAAVAVDVAAAIVVDLFETFAAAAALLLRSISASAFAFTFITSTSMTRSLLWSKAKLEARQHGTWSWLLQCLLSFSSTHSHTHTHGTHNKTEHRQTTADRRTVSASSGYISMSTKVKSNTAARRGELPLHIHGPYVGLLELRCVSGITFSFIRVDLKLGKQNPVFWTQSQY